MNRTRVQVKWLWLEMEAYPRAQFANELLVELSVHMSFKHFTPFLMTTGLLGGRNLSFICN